ncbi:hypothetical protein JMJ78_0001729 [Colletotrichum scovillei]|nr:hypothetical protein JMJ78_0001729 [Colletotrichum scovillei]
MAVGWLGIKTTKGSIGTRRPGSGACGCSIMGRRRVGDQGILTDGSHDGSCPPRLRCQQ